MAQNSKYKIRQIYNKVEGNKNKISVIKIIGINNWSINYNKNETSYDSGWILLDSIVTQKIDLYNFPEFFIADLNINLIIKPVNDTTLTNNNYQVVIPKFNYLIEKHEHKYVISYYIEPLYYYESIDACYKIKINSVNPKDYYELRARKE